MTKNENAVALERDLLTPEEACKLLDCSQRSLEYWKKLQGLPFVKIDLFVRIECAVRLDWFRTFTIKRGCENDG